MPPQSGNMDYLLNDLLQEAYRWQMKPDTFAYAWSQDLYLLA